MFNMRVYKIANS